MQYETAVNNGKLLLVARGTPEEVEQAKDILRQTQAKATAAHAEQVAVGV